MQLSIQNLQNINFTKNKESAFFLGVFGVIFTGALIFKQKNSRIHLSQSYNEFDTRNESNQNKELIQDISDSDTEQEENGEDKVLYLEDQQGNNKCNQNNNKNRKLGQLQQIQKTLKANNNQQKKQSENDLQRNQLLMEKILGIKDINQKDKVRVLVTSQNQEKIAAIESALKEIFPDFYLENGKVIIQAQKSDSGIPHGQPWGIQHTYEGAHGRIESIKQKMQQSQLFDKLNGYDLIISIENGVFPLLTHSQTLGYDIACVIIERKVDKQKQQLLKVKLSDKEQKEKDQKMQESALNLFGSQKSRSSMSNFLSQQSENGTKSYLSQNQVFSWERQSGFSMPRLYPLQNVQMQIQSGKSSKDMGKYIAQYYENKQLSLSRHDQIKQAIINTLNQFV